MANIKLNPVLEQLHDKVGGLVFKKYQDRTIVTEKAQPKQPNTPAQMAARQNFRLAALYGKTVMANPGTKAGYAAVAAAKKVPVFSLIVAGFLNPPVVDEIDLSAYTGKAGDVIKVRAHDEYKVTGVQVLVRDNNGTTLEQGAATLSGTDGSWQYTATASLPADQHVVIEVNAMDLPGHKGTKTQTQ
jgi:hypothetical protein